MTATQKSNEPGPLPAEPRRVSYNTDSRYDAGTQAIKSGAQMALKFAVVRFVSATVIFTA